MEKIKCIICSSSDYTDFLELSDRHTNETFTIVQCSCGFVYLNPRPKFSDISSFYKFDSYDPHRNNSILSSLYKFVRFIVFRYRYILIKRFATSSKQHLLDIGGGTGDFVNFMSHKGFNVVLQDLLHFKSKYKECKYFNKLDDINDSYKFETLSMWHSLEHIHDIKNLFNNINRLSLETSTLIIAVPNRTSIDAKIYQSSWIAWDAPRHLYHFTYNDIDRLLDNNGWFIYTSHTLIHDTIYNSLLSTENTIFKPLKFILASLFMLPLILLNKNYSSSRVYICRRK